MGSRFFLKMSSKIRETTIYAPLIKAILSTENLKSINKPNNAVPNAVEKTIKAVVKAFIDPRCFTP